MSGYPLLCLKNDIHERLQVIETERDAVVPGTGLILERAGKGRPEERARGTVHWNHQTGAATGPTEKRQGHRIYQQILVSD